MAEAKGVVLTERQLDQLLVYLSLLERWNDTINLTSLPLAGLPDATLEKLVGESLTAARLIGSRSGTWFDLGSGGGSPALPLKVVARTLHLTMVESRSRKVAFLREASRLMRISDAEVLSGRIEDLSTDAHRATAALVTSRAVRIDEVRARVIAKLLAPNGVLVLFGGEMDALLNLGLSVVDSDSPVSILRNVPRGT